MSQDFLPEDPKQEEVIVKVPFSTLATTAIVGALLGMCATLMYLHVFPQQQEAPRIAIVDSAHLTVSLMERFPNEEDKAADKLMQAIDYVRSLKDYGVIVLDHRAVLSAPDDVRLRPQEIIDSVFPEFKQAEKP